MARPGSPGSPVVISLAAPQSGQNVPSNRTSRATGSSSVPYQPRGALRLIGCVRSLAKQPVVIGMGADPEPHEPVFRFHGRSEERRVGKECRCRWVRCGEKEEWKEWVDVRDVRAGGVGSE